MSDRKYLKYNNEAFDALPELKSGPYYNNTNLKQSTRIKPKNLAFQLIRAHLIRKHFESNNRPVFKKSTSNYNINYQLPSRDPKDSKKNSNIEKNQQIFFNATKQKYEVNSNITKSKKINTTMGLVALIPQQCVNNQQPIYFRENTKRRCSLESISPSDVDSNFIDHVELNTREQLNLNKVNLNNLDTISKSVENFYDPSIYQINSQTGSDGFELNREGLIVQRFHESGDFLVDDNLRIHHSKRLLLPSITKSRYGNLDLSLNQTDFNTSYRISALNQKTLKDLHTKNLSVKETNFVPKPFFPDIY